MALKALPITFQLPRHQTPPITLQLPTCMETTDAYLLSLQMRHSSLNTTQNYLNDKRLKWDKLVENQGFKA